MSDANDLQPTVPRNNITGLILAGGASQRLGGRDKGLYPLLGRPLVTHVSERLAPQVASLLICCNRHHDDYAKLGYRLISDRGEGHAGPLHGIAAALEVCTTPYLAIAPCDTPALPDEWVTRLTQQLIRSGAELAVAHDGERLQPLCALWRVELGSAVAAYLAEGGAAPRDFYRRRHSTLVDFSAEHDGFINLNRPEEIAAYSVMIEQTTVCQGL